MNRVKTYKNKGGGSA